MKVIFILLLSFAFANRLYDMNETYRLSIGKNLLLSVSKSEIKLNKNYIMRVHYLDCLSVNFKVDLICNDEVLLSSSDDSYFELFINEELEKSCYENYTFRITPVEKSSKILSSKETIESIDFKIEITESKMNSNIKILHILFDKGLLSIQMIVFILLAISFLKYYISYIINSKVKVDNEKKNN